MPVIRLGVRPDGPPGPLAAMPVIIVNLNGTVTVTVTVKVAESETPSPGTVGPPARPGPPGRDHPGDPVTVTSPWP